METLVWKRKGGTRWSQPSGTDYTFLYIFLEAIMICHRWAHASGQPKEHSPMPRRNDMSQRIEMLKSRSCSENIGKNPAGTEDAPSQNPPTTQYHKYS